MCILCAIQKWSRRVATMLPWLVIPLIGLWALSQLLPPAFRFEITSPRLACVFVLLVTLFWYEILMPQLSAWRARRNAQLRERKRFEAIELQKLRKTATRRCRNCLTPYRDQNPGGGRFMCSYCGHISKRPVLDLPVPPGMGMSSNGILKDLVGKGGKIFNGKAWSDNGWMCGQDWLENGNWSGGSFSGRSSYWQKNGSRLFGANGDCLSESSNSGVLIFACKLLTSFFLSIRWLWRKIFRISSGDDMLSDSDDRGMASKKGENGANGHESRGEKARRKAEEKRQARLEKELLEEEERKQREEVARLVEERRRLRDEKEAENNRGKISSPVKEKNSRKESDRRRQERRKERDVGSSKSNSDAEEVEKRTVKESERKRDNDRKGEADRRESQKLGNAGNVKSQVTETGYGIKSTATNPTRGSAGARYFDRMKGSLLSSSRAFSGGSFFGRGASIPVSNSNIKENKSNSTVDYVHNSPYRRGISQPEHGATKPSMNGDDKNANRPVFAEPQPTSAPKKSWQQLFTRSSPVAPAPNTNVISRPTPKSPVGAQSPPLSSQALPPKSFDNPINFGLPSPFPISNYPSISSGSSLGFSAASEPVFSRAGEGLPEFIQEEPELFEDPCYVPDPISLLGPVSESLDNFQSDSGRSFTTDVGLERPRALKNVSGAAEVNKPSPIESPFSRSRGGDDKHKNCNQLSHPLKVRDVQTSVGDTNSNEKGTWQMWSSLTFGQDGLGLVGGSPSWLMSSDLSRQNKEEFVNPLSQRATESLLSKDDQVLSGTFSPQTGILSNGQNVGMFRPLNSSSDHDLWVEKAFFPPLSGSEQHIPLKPSEDPTQNEMMYGSPVQSSSSPFELSPANCWSKKEWASLGSGEGGGKSSVARPIGGLYSTPDVQSLW